MKRPSRRIYILLGCVKSHSKNNLCRHLGVQIHDENRYPLQSVIMTLTFPKSRNINSDAAAGFGGSPSLTLLHIHWLHSSLTLQSLFLSLLYLSSPLRTHSANQRRLLQHEVYHYDLLLASFRGSQVSRCSGSRSHYTGRNLPRDGSRGARFSQAFRALRYSRKGKPTRIHQE